MKCGVYKWTNKKSKKVYIGSTTSLEKRYKDFLTFTLPYAGALVNEERSHFPNKEYWEYEILRLCNFYEREQIEAEYINSFS